MRRVHVSLPVDGVLLELGMEYGGLLAYYSRGRILDGEES